MLDGVVQSAPTVQSADHRRADRDQRQVHRREAKQLTTVLETGALPVTLKFSESRVVGPTLGQDSLQQGLTALARRHARSSRSTCSSSTAGSASSLSLRWRCSRSLFLGILAVLSRFGLFALSLPGIAGIVLTIGMAADSSVLILERFKEEIGMGKTIRSAADSGSWHGVRTSVDADLVTLVSATRPLLRRDRPGEGLRAHADDRHRVRPRDDAHVQAPADHAARRVGDRQGPALLGRPKASEYAASPLRL